MSDNWIIIIPESPDFIPADEAQRNAVDLFRRIAPESDEVTAEATRKIQFFDCGGNFSRISCPGCGREIASGWWGDRMTEEYEADYPFHLLETPCCHGKYRIDELKYDWPQGFARFSVQATNPNIGDLSVEALSEFESILGCRVRKILRHI